MPLFAGKGCLRKSAWVLVRIISELSRVRAEYAPMEEKEHDEEEGEEKK